MDNPPPKTDINKRNDNTNKNVSYIPPHAVTNINKSRKIHIVFNSGKNARIHCSTKIC